MLPTPLLLALLSVASTALPGADDPVTGTWEALIAGDVEGLPPEGIPLVLGCELIDELEVRASLEMQGVRTDGIAATYDPETGELSFQANHAGVVVGADEAHRLVIDLRHNVGGNSSILSRQLPVLFAHPNLQAPGAIVALIGPRTYSSGMMNAEQIRQAGGVLLGEPTGGRPNSYGEVRSFRLPRTGLTVHYSTKYFRMLDDDPPAVLPDEPVPMTSSDWLGGQDPVLERALGR